MERLVVLLSALLLVLHCITASEIHDENGIEHSSTAKNYGQAWFGPRLARRKRAPGQDFFKTPAMERQQLQALMELIQESPWAVVAVSGNEGKRYDVNFVPRLGRNAAGEEVSNGGASNPGGLVDSELVSEVISQRSPPFAPRLGKRVLSFAPRLGRDNFQMDRA